MPDAGSTGRRVALVTGGSRGIGRSTVLALAARGTDVVFTWSADEAAARSVVEAGAGSSGRLVPLPLDVRDVETFPGFVDRLRSELARLGTDRLDALVNNAGVWHTGTLADTTVEDFDRLFAVNVRGLFFITQAVAPLLRDHGGRILNISSGLVRFTFPGKAAYAASKGAVEPLTRYLAAELGPRGITVNTVAPGATATDFSGGVIRDDPDYRARVASITALGRPAEPEDVGPFIASLLDDEARWLDGERIEVSGGMRL